MKADKKTLKTLLGGFSVGLTNGLFGAGGGILAVMLLKKAGMSQKDAHANSVAVIIPLCCVSATLYYLRGNIDMHTALWLIPFGLIGAVIGTFIPFAAHLLRNS